jgi:hypothetical protein
LKIYGEVTGVQPQFRMSEKKDAQLKMPLMTHLISIEWTIADVGKLARYI